MPTNRPKAPICRALCRRDSKGRVLKGSSLGGSRKGSPNLKTVIGHELFAALHEGRPEDGLPPAWERWTRLLTDPSAEVRLRAEALVAERCFGRTRQELDIAGTQEVVIRNEAWRPNLTHVHETID
jgi:hypothetical protein